MIEKDEFIASLNQDLRNPLNAILGNLELLEREAKYKVELDLIKNAKSNGEILLNIMNNILDA